MLGSTSGSAIKKHLCHWTKWSSRRPGHDAKKWWFCHVLSLRRVGCHMAVCQNLVPLVNIKIVGKWMFIPLKCIYRYWPIPTYFHNQFVGDMTDIIIIFPIILSMDIPYCQTKPYDFQLHRTSIHGGSTDGCVALNGHTSFKIAIELAPI